MKKEMKEIAKEFKKKMQEIADKSETTISVSGTGIDGEIVIAKPSEKTQEQTHTYSLHVRNVGARGDSFTRCKIVFKHVILIPVYRINLSFSCKASAEICIICDDET